MAGRARVSTDLSPGGRWTSLRGEPDHGEAWTRAWRDGDDRLAARYRLTADPGYRFVWAAHALLDVSASATLYVSGGPAVRLYPEAAALPDRPWPAGAPFVTERWPGPGRLRLDRLGPDDAVMVPRGGRVEWELEIEADGAPGRQP
jgi:hypothetical protein